MQPDEDFERFTYPPFDPTADLSHIVTNTKGRRASTRKRNANTKEVRAFLEAALELTSELFAPSPAARQLRDEDEDGRPTMSYLSRRKVVDRAQKMFPELVLTESIMRNRWDFQPDFLADFISYALTERHWSLQIALSESSAALLTGGRDFSGSVHRVAYEDLKLVLELPAYRFQLLAVASAQADSASAAALSRMYEHLSKTWTDLYAKVFNHYGLSFRPGITLQDFNIILQSTAEGLGMRLLSGVNEKILDDERRTSLLGTAALALFLGLVDLGDGLSLEQTVDTLLGSISNDGSSPGSPAP
ncbi:hypothetical protein [Paenarthrobacter sp. NPDC057981]|uniref:hypothetical protein n=1 Tax=Paenarthrobacter sp. NPDC057981 TaxID=3346297 RepID=UPI0036D85FEA